jgi:hypothetical protein
VDWKNDDFRLKPESPAFKLGFKAIPVEKIGVRIHIDFHMVLAAVVRFVVLLRPARVEVFVCLDLGVVLS